MHHAQPVPVVPGFYALVADEAVDTDSRHHRLLAGGGNAHQLTFVRAASCPTGHHPVPFGNLVLDSEVNVRKSADVDGDEIKDKRKDINRIPRLKNEIIELDFTFSLSDIDPDEIEAYLSLYNSDELNIEFTVSVRYTIYVIDLEIEVEAEIE